MGKHVGEIRAVTLAIYGARMRVVGGFGEAKFELKVTGTVDDAVVYTELQKHGVWEVQLARLRQENQPPVLLSLVPAAQPINSVR